MVMRKCVKIDGNYCRVYWVRFKGNGKIIHPLCALSKNYTWPTSSKIITLSSRDALLSC